MGARGAGGSGRGKRARPGVEFPTDPSQLKHIFREKHGIEDTPETRAMILETIRSENLLGANSHGNLYYTRLIGKSTEAWVEIRGSIIQNAGLNIPPNPNWQSTIVKGIKDNG